MSENPDGIKGAMIKPALLRKLSPTFDESNYGFSRLTDLLRSLDDVVSVVAHAGGGDVLVIPARSPVSACAPVAAAESTSQRRIGEANLAFYRYEHDSERRRRIVSRLFEAMSQTQAFSWRDVENHVLSGTSDLDTSLSPTLLSRYKTLLFQARCFVLEPYEGAAPQRDRPTRLREDIRSANDLIRTYETGVTYKIVSKLGADEVLSAAELADILGLPRSDQPTLEYCRALLDESNNE